MEYLRTATYFEMFCYRRSYVCGLFLIDFGSDEAAAPEEWRLPRTYLPKIHKIVSISEVLVVRSKCTIAVVHNVGPIAACLPAVGTREIRIIINPSRRPNSTMANGE